MKLIWIVLASFILSGCSSIASVMPVKTVVVERIVEVQVARDECTEGGESPCDRGSAGVPLYAPSQDDNLPVQQSAVVAAPAVFEYPQSYPAPQYSGGDGSEGGKPPEKQVIEVYGIAGDERYPLLYCVTGEDGVKLYDGPSRHNSVVAVAPLKHTQIAVRDWVAAAPGGWLPVRAGGMDAWVLNLDCPCCYKP